MEKKEMLKHANSKIHVQHAVLEKQIMTDMRHRNVVQVGSSSPLPLLVSKRF
jgi:hypothetical protein